MCMTDLLLLHVYHKKKKKKHIQRQQHILFNLFKLKCPTNEQAIAENSVPF